MSSMLQFIGRACVFRICASIVIASAIRMTASAFCSTMKTLLNTILLLRRYPPFITSTGL